MHCHPWRPDALCLGVAWSGVNDPEPRDYSVASDPTQLLWNIFTGLGIMAFAYGNTVLPGATPMPQRSHSDCAVCDASACCAQHFSAHTTSLSTEGR